MAVMQISRKVDYALRAMIYLTLRNDPRPCSVAEIAAREGVPRKFLEKIVQDLIRHGLVRSTRGAQGGCTLAREPEVVTFKDVIEAIDGPVSVNVCVGDNSHSADCTLFPHCGMLWVWQEAQRRVIDLFGQTTLADVRARQADLPAALAGAAANRGPEYAGTTFV